MSSIGRKIRILRKRRGLSLRGLGKLAGIGGTAIANIESGYSNGQYLTIEALLNAMGYELVIVERGICDEAGNYADDG